MTKYFLTCQYCNHCWEKIIWSISKPEVSCPICKEKKNIKMVPDKRNDVFGYEDSSPKQDAYIKSDNNNEE